MSAQGHANSSTWRINLQLLKRCSCLYGSLSSRRFPQLSWVGRSGPQMPCHARSVDRTLASPSQALLRVGGSLQVAELQEMLWAADTWQQSLLVRMKAETTMQDVMEPNVFHPLAAARASRILAPDIVNRSKCNRKGAMRVARKTQAEERRQSCRRGKGRCINSSTITTAVGREVRTACKDRRRSSIITSRPE